MLQTIDQHWREHLSALDHLRQGIHLRGYAQKNPKQEYKREAFELFSLMQERVRSDVARILMTVQIQSAEEVEQAEEAVQPHFSSVNYTHADFAQTAAAAETADPEAIALAVQHAPQAEDSGQQPLRRLARRSAATTRAPAARARNTSNVTAGSRESRGAQTPMP